MGGPHALGDVVVQEGEAAVEAGRGGGGEESLAPAIVIAAKEGERPGPDGGEAVLTVESRRDALPGRGRGRVHRGDRTEMRDPAVVRGPKPPSRLRGQTKQPLRPDSLQAQGGGGETESVESVGSCLSHDLYLLTFTEGAATVRRAAAR